MKNFTIVIDALTTKCSIGIYPHEKKRLQTITIDIKIKFSNQKDRKTNDKYHIQDSIDYEKIYHRALFTAQKKHYDLVEELGEKIAIACYDEVKENNKIHLNAIEVSIIKKNILKKAKNIGVLLQFNYN